MDETQDVTADKDDGKPFDKEDVLTAISSVGASFKVSNADARADNGGSGPLHDQQSALGISTKAEDRSCPLASVPPLAWLAAVFSASWLVCDGSYQSRRRVILAEAKHRDKRKPTC